MGEGSQNELVMSSAAVQKQGAAGRRWRFGKLAAALFILFYFLYFSWFRLRTYFAADDMMNMASYFRAGPWRALVAQFLFWKAPVRPMGAVFYLPLFRLFGLNPAPYQAAIVLLLGINAYLAYRLVKVLGASELVAGLTALLVCYHPGLTSLQYNTDMIYDVLCFLFFFAALLYYVSVRAKCRLLSRAEMAVFLLLYLCALNSKEMAVTIPLLLVAYEWIYYGAPKNYSELRTWLSRGPGFALLLAAGIDIVFVISRVIGPNALTKGPGYRPVFARDRLVAFQEGALHDLLCLPQEIGWIGVLVIWICFTYLAFRRNRPLLGFAWLYTIITPIPIEFLEARFEGELYIPMVGWAIAAVVILVDLANFVARSLADEPLFRLAGKRALFAGVIAGALILWSREIVYLLSTTIEPSAAQQGLLTRDVIRQLDDLRPSVRPHSSVVFLDDPFKNYNMQFIMQLWLRDRTVNVQLQRLDPRPPNDIARADHVFTFEDGRLIQIR
jgi:hypothetical protein